MPPFIICEAGVNWRDLVDADDMIREAAKAGADAVKFQAYRVSDLSTLDYPPEIIAHLAKIELNESTIRYLYWRCQQHGVEFLCTPMYPEAVDLLNPYVKRWKIRYADRDNEEIIHKCEKTGKPMLISGKNLFCTPEYPPGILLDYKDNAAYVGISHHVPKVAGVCLDGFDFFEVHVRLDKYDPHYCPIDTAVSITMSELAELCRRLK